MRAEPIHVFGFLHRVKTMSILHQNFKSISTIEIINSDKNRETEFH